MSSDYNTDYRVGSAKTERCRYGSCFDSSMYNYPGSKTALYCKKHRLEGMTNVVTRRCISTDCTIIASYNYPCKKSPIYCNKHKLDSMINVVNKKCSSINCTVRASYNYTREKIGLYCNKHKLEGMVNVSDKRCNHVDCTVYPSYNYTGEKVGLYCNKHKLEGMVNVGSKKCNRSGCLKQPSYNYPGEKVRLYCSKHKLDGMIAVKNKTCDHDNCTVNPVYNYPGQKTGLYCSKHKLDGMVDVVNKRCNYGDCIAYPVYNYPGEKTGLYCSKHKLDGMVDVVSKRCTYGDGVCSKRASYILPNDNHLIYCKDHAPPDAILNHSNKCIQCNKRGNFYTVTDDNIKAYYCANHATNDAISIPRRITCIVDDCTSIPRYSSTLEGKSECCMKHRPSNYYYSKGSRCQYTNCREKAYYSPLHCKSSVHCSDHKLDNEYGRWRRFPKCEYCTNSAYYASTSTEFPTKCSNHAEDEDVNLVEKPCKTCSISYIMYSDQNECWFCDPTNKPKESRKLVHQERVRNILDNRGIEHDSYDRMIEKGTYKYRPDFIVDRDTYNLYIEIDEKQHKSYDQACEVIRMYNIHSEYLTVPSVFVRYNPDSWTDSEGSRHDEGSIASLLDVLIRLTDTELSIEQSLLVIYICYDGGPVQCYEYCENKQTLVPSPLPYTDSLVEEFSKLTV